MIPHPDDAVRLWREHEKELARELRHLLLDVGVQPKIVSDRMGHANMNVIFQIYGHRSTGRDREAADLVGGLIHRETARIEPQ